MRTCDALRDRLREWAPLTVGELPAELREHLVTCPACTRALAGARLACGLVAAGGAGAETRPAPGFANRVLAALPAAPARARAQADLWRPARGLVPAFAATAAVLLFLFSTSAVPTPEPAALLGTGGFSPSERLVLETPSPAPELILSTVLEGNGP